MSFFDTSYRTPLWFKKKINRRQLLKSAAGATAVVATHRLAIAQPILDKFSQDSKQDPWLTLNSVLNHLLPSSESGPGAKEINASLYLYHVVNEQTVDEAEKTFIVKGVGWLNGYSKSQLDKVFTQLSHQEKETMLRGISGSRAGNNWLNTLINYL